MNHWLVKQEQETYAWKTFVADGRATWDGVRNFQARNNLRGMRRGDPVLFYASGGDKCVLGIARVAREAYPDPTATAEDGDWSAVDLEPIAALKKPVTLATVKAKPALKDILLVRNSRLSVMPIPPAAFDTIVKLGEGQTKLP
jgi:predicted RNA-binding protein with PUA-like domain